MSHTPGPWHARDRGIGWEVHIGAQCPPEGWCDTVNRGFRDTFSEPDARLIAAAPELLEALKQVLDSAVPNPTYHPTMFPAWEYAKSVLAKAEGHS